MYRTRTKASGEIVRIGQFTFVDGGVPQPSSSLVWSRFGDSSTCQDVSVPNYKELIASGKIVANDCFVTKDKHDELPGTIQSIYRHKANTYFNWINYPVFEDYLFTQPGTITSRVGPPNDGISGQLADDLLARAKQQCIERINKSPNNMVEDALEFRKTISTLRNPMNSVRQVSNKLKRLDSRALSNAWLSARFEYGQLIYSAMTISDVVNRQQNGLLASRNNARLVCRSSSFGKELTGTQVVTKNVSDISGHSTQWSEEFLHSYSVKCGIIYRLKKMSIDFSYNSGLRLRNLPRGIWNVLPYTWVTDRFLDVSSMIQGGINLADPNVEIEYGWINTKTRNFVEYTNPSEIHPDWTVTLSGSKYSDISSFSRVSWIPKYSDTVPVFNTDTLHEFKEVLDLASLVLNRVGKVSKK